MGSKKSLLRKRDSRGTNKVELGHNLERVNINIFMRVMAATKIPIV